MAKIGFDHIWRSVGHLESDDLEKTTQLFILRHLILSFSFNLILPVVHQLSQEKKRYGRTDRRTDGQTDIQTDRRTDGQDKNIYASSPLGGGIITSKPYSHWNTLEKWTLAYKIGHIGHTDLISGRWCEGHLRTSHVWFELHISSSYDLCLVNGRTDRRTDAGQQRVT